jgi:hypothetical protein
MQLIPIKTVERLLIKENISFFNILSVSAIWEHPASHTRIFSIDVTFFLGLASLFIRLK